MDEIDNSIRFFTSQSGAPRLTRVLLAGSGSRLAGLHERLSGMTGVPVELARPSEWVAVDAGLNEEDADRAEANLPTVIGLALAAAPISSGRRINLLPTDVTRVRAERTQIVGAGAAVIAIAALLGTLWALRGNQINSKKKATQEAQAEAATLNQQIAELGGQTQIEQVVTQKEQQVRSALSGDVDWSRLLKEIASAMPDDVWLTSFNGTSANAGTGQITVGGKGLSQPSTARWIQRIGSLASISDLWVANSSGTGNDQQVTFSSSANLTSSANSDRMADFTGKSQP